MKKKIQLNNGKLTYSSNYVKSKWDGDEPEDFTEYLISGFDDDMLQYDGQPVEFIEQDGGGEGGTEYCYTILKVGDDYFKFEYSYYSFDGYNVDDYEGVQVFPTLKTITVFE